MLEVEVDVDVVEDWWMLWSWIWWPVHSRPSLALSSPRSDIKPDKYARTTAGPGQGGLTPHMGGRMGGWRGARGQLM